jgi:aryl-alcohol dehydrogenase-like predicted oxidoreductase
MEYRRLGRTDLSVSLIALGSMTWGEQNSEEEAHEQLDYAVECGVNLIDTAEMYSIPPRAETFGRTEEIIGSWLAKGGRRDQVILASKVAGPCGEWMPHVRDGHTHLDRANIVKAVDGSLRRLRTDYLDLYQVHWPERKTNFFGQLGYVHDPDDRPVPIVETLSVLGDLVQAGKVRHVGVSNETPWGVTKYLHLTEGLELPRIVSVQNPYSLLNRTFEIGLAEIAHREDVGLLAYSPLGFGALSGKYVEGRAGPEARLHRFPHYDRYSNEQAVAATRAYTELARDHGLEPAQMALAFVNSRPFVAANIIGATSLAQLRQDIDAIAITLTPAVQEAIEAIHRRFPNPSP